MSPREKEMGCDFIPNPRKANLFPPHDNRGLVYTYKLAQPYKILAWPLISASLKWLRSLQNCQEDQTSNVIYKGKIQYKT